MVQERIAKERTADRKWETVDVAINIDQATFRNFECNQNLQIKQSKFNLLLQTNQTKRRVASPSLLL